MWYLLPPCGCRPHVPGHALEFPLYPLPGVVCTDAPVGHTRILRESWTRDHPSAVSAVSPEGQRFFHSQAGALNAADVVSFLEHWRREVSGLLLNM